MYTFNNKHSTLMVVGAIKNLVIMTIKISNYYHYIISGDWPPNCSLCEGQGHSESNSPVISSHSLQNCCTSKIRKS